MAPRTLAGQGSCAHGQFLEAKDRGNTVPHSHGRPRTRSWQTGKLGCSALILGQKWEPSMSKTSRSWCAQRQLPLCCLTRSSLKCASTLPLCLRAEATYHTNVSRAPRKTSNVDGDVGGAFLCRAPQITRLTWSRGLLSPSQGSTCSRD